MWIWLENRENIFLLGLQYDIKGLHFETYVPFFSLLKPIFISRIFKLLGTQILSNVSGKFNLLK